MCRPDVTTWQQVIAWCKLRTAYKRTKLLSELARKPNSNPRINALLEEARQLGAAEQRVPEAPDDQPPAWAQTLITALTPAQSIQAVIPPPPKPAGDRPRGREKRRNTPGDRGRSRSSSTGSNRNIRMSIKFKGCWHCGEEGRSRTANARLNHPGSQSLSI